MFIKRRISGLRNKLKDFLEEEIKFQNIIVPFAVQAGKGREEDSMKFKSLRFI